MEYVTDLKTFQADGESAVTLGKFDALHKGHQKLIHKIQKYSSDQQVKSIVFAFDMHRDSLLTPEEKRTFLENETDVLISCPFTQEIRQMEAAEFIEEILVNKLHAKYIVVGTDFHFGYQQKGDVQMLAEFAPRCGYSLDVIEKAKYHGREISSTYIREALAEGDVALANELLGYTYQMKGTVQHGNHLGHKLGFPTMNVMPPARKIMPRYGVYTCRVKVDKTWYNAIGNVGVKPTVTDDPVLLVEAYVYGYEGDAYGKEIIVRFCEFVRPEMKFDGVRELKERLERDVLFGERYFEESL